MKLRGDRVVLRPLAETDVGRIVELGANPEVARWWRGLTPEHVLEKARGEDEGVEVFAILVEEELVGRSSAGRSRTTNTGTPASTSFSVRSTTAAASVRTP